jgi:hypothetical protein
LPVIRFRIHIHGAVFEGHFGAIVGVFSDYAGGAAVAL